MAQSILLTKEEQVCLLQRAQESISYGLKEGSALKIDLENYGQYPNLQKNDASFVTLTIDNQLRGCMGALSAYQPLIIDVVEHSFMAAFKDTRFTPLNIDEFIQLHYHISVLEPATVLSFSSEAELLEQLALYYDGLILKAGHHQATFLPSVWQHLSDKKQFLQQLKLKAGLDKDYWGDDISAFKYRVFEFSS